MKHVLMSLLILVTSVAASAEEVYFAPGTYESGPGYFETTNAVYIIVRDTQIEAYSVAVNSAKQMEVNKGSKVVIDLQKVNDTDYIAVSAVGTCPGVHDGIGKILKMTRTGGYLVLEMNGEALAFKSASADEISFLTVLKALPNNYCEM